MRKRRADQKIEKMLNEIHSDPIYQSLSPEKQKEIDEAFLKTLDLIDVILGDKFIEAEQYTKMRIDQWAEKMLVNIQKLVEISRSQKQTETPIINEENKNE